MNYLRTLVLVLLPASFAYSQEATVTPTHISGNGHTPVPRFSAHYQSKLVVPANTMVTLPASTDVDVIEVSGTLRVSRTDDTVCRFIHLQVLPGGTLDVGTPNDPVLRKVDFVVKDSPLLTGTAGTLGPDPEQFGNGVLVFGAFFVHGRPMARTWTTMPGAAAGATTLTTTERMQWQVGDELLIPDTRQPYFLNYKGILDRPLRRESSVKIAAISGDRLTLTKGLDFEHLGVSGYFPYVANATRNIVFRSENAAGVRGHCMFMDTAHVHLYFASFLGLGRTASHKIHNFNPQTGELGINQIGRYALHWHHVHGHADAQGLTGRAVGLFCDGYDVSKWGGVVQHGTHDLLVQDCVGDRCPSGAFAVEDGYEVRGQYIRCLGHGSRNTPAIINGRAFPSDGKGSLVDPSTFAPGAEGAAFWFHGSRHTVEDCVAIGSSRGFSFTHMAQVTGRLIPSQPGGAPDTAFDPLTARPISFKWNVALANEHAGLELWRTDFVGDGFTVLNSGLNGIELGNGEGAAIELTNSRISNEPINRANQNDHSILVGLPGVGLMSSGSYNGPVFLDKVTIDGFREAVHDAQPLTITNSRLRSLWAPVNGGMITHNPWDVRIENTLLERMDGGPDLLVLGQGLVPWDRDPRPFGRWEVFNWQGSGRSFRLHDVFEPPPAAALAVAGVVNALGVEIGTPPPANRPPVVSPITADAIDVDPANAGLQVYPGTVTYSYTTSDPDGDALTKTIYYSINGGPQLPYNGPASDSGWAFTYPTPVSYRWTVQVDDGKSTSESSLAVEVIARPVEPSPPPAAGSDLVVRQLLKDIAELIKARLP